MFKKIWNFIKSIFGNNKKTNFSTNKTVNKTNNIINSKGKNNTIINIGKQFNNTTDAEDGETDDDFVFKARWYYYIPTKIVGYGVRLNDNECIRPSLSLHCNSPQAGRAGIYMLFRKSYKVYNLKIIRIHIKLESFEYINDSYNKDIFGILNTDYAVNISDEKMEEGNGTFTILLQYEKNDKIFRQLFEFEMFDDARYFVIKHYNKPKLVQSE